MKALFIWNKSSENHIKKHTIKVNQFSQGRDGKFITNEEDFQSLMNDWDNSYTKIYILAELDWIRDNLFEGYQRGFEIIDKWNAKSTPCIEFFSITGRKNIYNLVEDKFKFLVKAFPFTDVLKIDDTFKFSTKEMSISKWNSFKTYALTDYGILDVISHRLDSLDENNNDFEKSLIPIIKELKSYVNFTGNEIQKHLQNSEYNNAYIYDLKYLVESRIEEITGEVKVKKFELPANLKIVIVEDDLEDARVILNGIKRHYKNEDTFKQNVILFTEGEKALSFIKNTDNVIDIVISDLQLLDDEGFYQDVQGVDIFEEANKLFSTVVGIITGFGRKGVSKLLDYDSKYILLKKHLKRFNANEEIDDFLQILYFQYEKIINTGLYKAGPKEKGWMKNPVYRKLYSNKKNSNPKLHIDNYKKAKKFAQQFIDGELTFATEGWDSKLLKTKDVKEKSSLDNILKKHYSFLTQRLIVISYLINNDLVYVKNNFKETVSDFIERTDFGKTYLTTLLGFTTQLYSSLYKETIQVSNGIIKNGKYEGENKDDVRIIKFVDLFPEEREWLLKLGYNTPLSIKSQSNECADWLNKSFKTFYPNIDFGDISFEELLNYIKELKDKKLQGKIDENIISLIFEDVPKNIDQYLTDKEKKVLSELNNLYQS